LLAGAGCQDWQALVALSVVHHDLWDYDLTTGPKLLTIRHDGKMVDVVAQPTKFGFLYVFDRVTGQSLWPVEERAVPQSDMPGEHSWPTQPFPTNPPPYARQKFTVDDINPYVEPEEKERLRNILLNARNEGIFTPQTKDRDQIGVPGENGGANWGVPPPILRPECFMYVLMTRPPYISFRWTLGRFRQWRSARPSSAATRIRSQLFAVPWSRPRSDHVSSKHN